MLSYITRYSHLRKCEYLTTYFRTYFRVNNIIFINQLMPCNIIDRRSL